MPRSHSTSGGSSPLARGALAGRILDDLEHGLIPARAGSTHSDNMKRGGNGAHPRSRGEHRQKSFAPCARRGSSPLARGAPWLGLFLVHFWGLIPARAGSTQQEQLFPVQDGAHPRSRGEHGTHSMRPAPPLGSSPLARGAPLLAHHLAWS